LIFLTEKKDRTIKARHCANGSPQRDWMNREEVSSPTVNTESTLLTVVIEAEEERDIATCDIPNAFIQTHMEEKDQDGNRTIMKIRGVLVDILCYIDPKYKYYVEIENEKKILYVHITKAIYGLLASAMLFYRRFTKDLTEFGFKINPYDPCVANKLVDGEQMTVSWHVDDLKVSHINKMHIDDFITWIKQTYGSIGEVKTTRGKIHEYLGMKLDYSVKRQVTIDMVDYVKKMIKEFPDKDLKCVKVTSPWNENLFKVNETSPLLSKEMAEQFHKSTAQGLFLCKRGRSDISSVIAYLTTRVRNPTQDDWMKLTKMMKFLKQTSEDKLTLKADGSRNLK
jgi:Reverse transcriptase (RNA-dependent DNA polymerase)